MLFDSILELGVGHGGVEQTFTGKALAEAVTSPNQPLSGSCEGSPGPTIRRYSVRLNGDDKGLILHKAIARKARLRESESSRVADRTVWKAIRKSRSCGVNLGVAEAESFV